LAITAALETTKFNFSVSGKLDAFRTLAGTGTIPAKNKVPSNFIDFSQISHLRIHQPNG
jgi:Fe(3+) dicitrate transport protein